MEKFKKEDYGKTYNFLFEYLESVHPWDGEAYFVFKKILDIENGFNYIFTGNYSDFHNSVSDLVVLGILINIRSICDYFGIQKFKSPKVRLFRLFANMEAHRTTEYDFLSWHGMNDKVMGFKILDYDDFIKKHPNPKGYQKEIINLIDDYLLKSTELLSYVSEERLISDLLEISYNDFNEIDKEFYSHVKLKFQKTPKNIS